MSSSLNDLMTAMTIQTAYHNDWTIAVAHAHVHQQLVHAQSQYRALGAPYNNNEEGFVRWITGRASRQELTAQA